MIKPPSCPVVVNSEMSAQRSKTRCHTTHCQNSAIPTIPFLFGHRRPFAISRFVPTVIVDSLNRESSRSFPHVSQKVDEREPSFADFNPASTVIFKVRITRVGATLNHYRPFAICSAFGFPMLNWTTAATFGGRTFLQGHIEHSGNRATLALHHARASSATTRHPMNRAIAENFPFAKPSSDKRDFSRHNESGSLCLVASGTATTGPFAAIMA
jgi:hypothetical protein